MIKVRENENIESALRRFKKQTQKAEIMKDFKKHEVYESKSVKRRRKHENHLKRLAREERKAMKYYEPTIL